jgi:hypothetical protein
LVEQQPFKLMVLGSSPSRPTKNFANAKSELRNKDQEKELGLQEALQNFP